VTREARQLYGQEHRRGGRELPTAITKKAEN
jgi:hypothetical protein